MIIDIFCKVIDNYGDIGVCWRLTRELTDLNKSVNLYVDDLNAFKKINNSINPDKEVQNINYNNKTIHVIHWNKTNKEYSPGDMVIEAFACNLDKNCTEQLTEKNIWINLEYLSAENWVEDCHQLPSLQNNNLKKYFFFPGFTEKTGGLNFNTFLKQYDKNVCRQIVLNYLKLSSDLGNKFWFFLFCYENTNIKTLLEQILKHHPEGVLLLPESLISKYLHVNNIIEDIKQKYPKATFIEFSMIPQEYFDIIIKSTDLNIVRGEDSITQAILAGVPFIWHIYEQEENVHIEKLKAMIEKFEKFLPEETKEIYKDTLICFNEKNISNNILCAKFDDFMLEYTKISEATSKWSAYLYSNKSLGTNLIRFYENLTKTRKS